VRMARRRGRRRPKEDRKEQSKEEREGEEQEGLQGCRQGRNNQFSKPQFQAPWHSAALGGDGRGVPVAAAWRWGHVAGGEGPVSGG
jgi:hypothetical protein